MNCLWRLPFFPDRVASRAGRVIPVIIAIWIMFPPPASADCVNGARDVTEEEKETTVRVLTALRNAFPANSPRPSA